MQQVYVAAVVCFMLGIAIAIGVSHWRQRKWLKAAEAERKATLDRMETEFFRQMEEMQRHHQIELEYLTNVQTMKSFVEPTSVRINQFNYAVSHYYN